MLGILKSFFGQSDNSELKDAVAGDTFLVDVRSPVEFAAGSVPGAANIPLEKIYVQLARFKGKHSIVVFCRSGNRSSEAKRILERHGFENVINGGSWQNVKQVIGS